MKSTFTKFTQKTILTTLLLSMVFTYFSCVKTTTSPSTTSSAPKPASYTASVNGSPTITFTPSKTVSGGVTSLIGTSTYYTITLTFPSTTGTGSFFFNTTGFNANIYNGTSNYSTSNAGGTGSIQIDSILNGKYYGRFQFIGANTSSATLSVNAGYFGNL